MPFSFSYGLIASIMIFRNKSLKYYILIFSFLLLSGCSVWENFTTYFNLYYNTKSLFDDAEANILNQRKELFSNQPLVAQGNDKNTLTKVIEKCSNILQFDPNSSYVDEALMMLGKSFYYQGNIQKAERKFEELIATNPSDEEELLQAKLWIVKCQFILHNDDEALKSIETIRKTSVDNGYDEIIKDSYIEEIKYYLREENYPQAISLENEFANVYDDSKTRAKIYFELGNLYSLTEDYANAIIAYEKVFDNSPDFDLEINATIKYADALRQAGQYEKALKVFEDVRNKDKFSDTFNQIDVEIGKTLVGLGKYNEAYNQFKMVDSVYKNTQFAAVANYELGDLYRWHLANFDSASYYYSKAASSTLPKEYIDSAKSNNQLFTKYSKLRKDISGLNRQLFYTQNPDIFNKDSIVYTQDSLKILNDYLAKKELQDIWSNVSANLQTVVDSTKIKDSLFVKDSLAVRDSLVKIDSLISIGLYNAQDTVGLRQKIFTGLNQKRIDDVVADRQKNLRQLQSQGQVRLDTVKFKRNPPLKLKIPIDSAKTLLAKNSLELGNLFLTELDAPDSAYNMYSIILKDYPTQNYYPNTLYAMGSYYLTQNNKREADSLFNIIYDNYKNRSIVNAAADKLNKPLIDLNYDPAKDQYASAESLMINGNYKESLNKLHKIYDEYPKSSYAPKALYASGWILENNLVMPDSAASIYDSLVSRYPTTVYGKKVVSELTLYRQEKDRIQKAIQDSLAKIEKLNADSIIVTTNNVVDKEPVNEQKTNQEDKPIKEPAEENVGITQVANGNGHKKLEPLWDPRKHFQ
jgi:TolA-binding protein